MAKESTKKRVRRAAKRLEQQRRSAFAAQHPLRPQRGRGFPDSGEWRDEGSGGAGVREPRRPRPTMPSGVMELDLPRDDQLRDGQLRDDQLAQVD